VELDHGLQADHRRRAQRQAAPQLRARRPEGRLRQDLALRPDGHRGARKNADASRRKMIAGSFDIFKGELKDNKGKVVILQGQGSSRPTSSSKA
jgi:hypothetical protein